MPDINLDEIFKDLPTGHLLRIDQVARFLGMTTRTIYNKYPDILKGTNLDGSIRIFRTSVIEYVTANIGKKNNDENPAEIEKKCAPKEPQRKHSSWVKSWKG